MPVYGMDAFLAAAAADDERIRGTKPTSRAADPASSRSSTSSAASQWDLHVGRRTTAPAPSIATRAPTPRAPPAAAPPSVSVSRTQSAPDVMPAAPPSRHVLLQTPMNGTVARPADSILRPAPPTATRAGSASSLARSAIATPAPMAARSAARVPADFPTPSQTTCDDMVTEDFYGPAPPSSRSPRPAADPREDAENMAPRSRGGAAGRMRPPMPASTPAPASRSRSHAVTSRDEEARRMAAAALPPGAVLDESVVVKGIRYWPTEELGHGGTSVVYRALSSKNREWYAVKRVKLDANDPVTSATYLEEARLLERLNDEQCDAVIQLIGYELSSCKRYLYLVLELGETDMAKVLKRAATKPLDLALVRYYWRLMIECVHRVHQHRVVHADLKPANFLLVKNQLKLIDFGIAKLMAPDTTKVFHENQVGTLNYMAPEAVLGLDSDVMEQTKRMRLNRGSDVWSLGVILYQMLYGRTPFAHLTADQRMKRIPDPKFAITFPRLRRGATPASAFLPTASGSSSSLSPAELEPIGLAVQAVQLCLQREAAKRCSLADLLVHPFVAPERYMAGAAGDTYDEQWTSA
ncbi:TTK protein kinase [Allomyces macrogynus ATCC 38327]|uniref:TTK protein kinase n=1 Tax=Allomyces macrogynus (strain ATCC 38327) TaxID=578462 RepID=A0A0L0T6Y5_ALLM3|nr:TTK protein kinase [Allomyces macrogynus ATCC 38327]|eukprot:KNE70558.1 TTK protein kinase [Allomyces macrogynus ATCC 38327]